MKMNFLRRGLVVLAGFVLPFCGFAGDAGNTNAPVKTAPQPLSPLVSFILNQGEAGNSEAYLNRNLQLGDQDLAVVQKGWKGKDQLNHLVVIPQNDHAAMVILRYTKEVKGVGWLTSPAGQIRQTIEFDRTPHESHVVGNETHASEFELEKRFLLGKALVPRTPFK